MSNDLSDSTPPDGWKRRSLDDLVVSMRKSAKIVDSAMYELWSVPSFSDGCPEYVLGSSIGSGKLAVSPGDVLISKINPRINRVWVVAEPRDALPQVSSTEWLIARIKDAESLNRVFLRNYLSSPVFREWISGATSSVTGSHSRAKSEQILEQMVPIPPLVEQEKIVEILEEQLSRLDAALEAVRAVRVKAAQFRRSLLHAAFTGALTGHDTSSGTLPAGWEDVSAGEIARLNYGYTESASADPVGPKFLRITDIQDGRVSWDDVPYCLISPENEQKHRLISGDIVFARTGATTGKSFLIMDPPNAVCASYLIRLQPKVEMVRPQYLQYFFQSDGYWQQVRAETTGTAQGGVNASKLSKLTVVLPPLGEQERIVEILEEQLSRLDASLALANTVEKRAAALRRSLLHAAFTGNLTKQWRENAHV